MRKIFYLLIIMIMAQSLLLGQKKAKRVELNLEENTWHIRSVANGKYIDIPGISTKNGANVQLWDLDDGGDRKVKFIPTSDGYYSIRFQHANMNMDVHGCFDGRWFCGTYKSERGANIQIWKADLGKPQQWKIEQINPGQFRIKNRYSGKYLDASKRNINKNGCNVLQWNWHGGNNQLWEIVDVKTGQRYQL